MSRRWVKTLCAAVAVSAALTSQAPAIGPRSGLACTPTSGNSEGPFSFGDIMFFGFGSPVLSVRASHILDETVRYAVCNHVGSLVIEAHEDGAEKASGAIGLDLRRAEAVRNYLVGQGLQRSRLILLTRGDTEPLVPTARGAAEPQNRFVRIEFR